MSSQNIYFQCFAGDNIYFHPTSAQTIYFTILPIWIWWMQDYLFIFLGTQARIFILRCLTARMFILKNCQPPPPPPTTFHPLIKKWDQFQPLPNSTDCHTQHIAMPHGLWPSVILHEVHGRYHLLVLQETFPNNKQHQSYNYTGRLDKVSLLLKQHNFSSEQTWITFTKYGSFFVKILQLWN